MSTDWGSVPDWLAGVGAVVALAFAGIAARTTNKQIGQLEKQNRSSQASLVAFWVSSEFNDDATALVRYVSSSVLPVYNVLICCHTPAGTAEERYPVLGPLSDRRTLRRATAALWRRLENVDFAREHEDGRVLVAVSFKDAAGAWWYRTAGGELHEAPTQAVAEAGARTWDEARSMQHSGSTKPGS